MKIITSSQRDSCRVTVNLAIVPRLGAPFTGPDHRSLVIPLDGAVCHVGRSSKNVNKNLRPLANNALFDCAVMSRDHATFSAPDGPHGDIKLQDTGSMHGVYVNDKQIRCITIHPRDEIRFGSPVTRSDSALHEGVVVRVTSIIRDSTSSTDMNTQTKTIPGTYVVPESSDSDAEDSHSPPPDYATASKQPPLLIASHTKPEVNGLTSHNPLVVDDEDLEHANTLTQHDRPSPGPYNTSEQDYEIFSDISDDDSVEYAENYTDSDHSEPEDDDEEMDYEDDEDTPSQRSQSEAPSAAGSWRSESVDQNSEAEDTQETVASPSKQADINVQAFSQFDKPCPAWTDSDKDRDINSIKKSTSSTVTLPPIASMPTYPRQAWNNDVFTYSSASTLYPVPHEDFSHPVHDLTWNNTEPAVYDAWNMPPLAEPFTSMTMPPAAMAHPVPLDASHEVNTEQQVQHKKDSVVFETLRDADVQALDQLKTLSNQEHQGQTSQAGAADDTKINVGEKRKRVVEDDGNEGAEYLVEPTTSTGSRLFLRRRPLWARKPESAARPAKRAKHTKKDVALGAIAGAVGGVVAVFGVLMSSQCEQLMADWPVA